MRGQGNQKEYFINFLNFAGEDTDWIWYKAWILNGFYQFDSRSTSEITERVSIIGLETRTEARVEKSAPE